jgi:SAM-dependent methyltransferase
MSIAHELRSFHRRRIDIPVDDRSLVLDIGSGDKPHWRADVLLDRFPGAEHGGQRSGQSAARIDRPTFDADAEDMPFADQVFDYVICSHVLEHVRFPERVIAEMMRVGRAGYIEVPEASSAKIVDFPSHLWWCTRVDDALIFTAKEQPFFDSDIDRFLTASGLRTAVTRVLDSRFDHRVIELPWSTTIPHRVVGSVSDHMWNAAHDSDATHRGRDAFAARVATRVMALPRRRQRRATPVRLDDIVKPELRNGSPQPLTAQLYTV